MRMQQAISSLINTSLDHELIGVFYPLPLSAIVVATFVHSHPLSLRIEIHLPVA